MSRCKKIQIGHIPFRNRFAGYLPYLLAILTFSVGCTNYSSEDKTVNPPILLGIKADGDGHLITVAAQNLEIGFQGYRLYQGISETDARNKDGLDGVDCTFPLTESTSRGIEYTIEVRPGISAPTSTDYVCAVPLQLTSGTWITMRSLIFADFYSSDTSISSNALTVP